MVKRGATIVLQPCIQLDFEPWPAYFQLLPIRFPSPSSRTIAAMGVRHLNTEMSSAIGMNGTGCGCRSGKRTYRHPSKKFSHSVARTMKPRTSISRQNSCVESIPDLYHNQVPGLQLQQELGSNCRVYFTVAATMTSAAKLLASGATSLGGEVATRVTCTSSRLLTTWAWS